MSRLIIGVDGGLDGALVGLDDQGRILFKELMPTLGVKGKGRRTYDIPAITAHFHGLEDVHVWLEAAAPRPIQGVVAAFGTGFCFGLFQGILTALNMPFTVIRPQQWQKVMFEGLPKTDTKQASAIIAKRLKPDEDWRATERSKKVSDGYTDAYLIAEYGRRKERL